jgi:nitroimidazol reductase NimA-like FMN-containing flavoprotein (pyridoxamine 5'-phosphate oxidase superfamily)
LLTSSTSSSGRRFWSRPTVAHEADALAEPAIHGRLGQSSRTIGGDTEETPLTELAPTPRTTGKRLRERYRYAEADLHAVLDAALVCHVSFVVDGQPRIIPTLHARIGDALYLHGSSGATLALAGRSGVQVAVGVTLIDGLVMARSGFHHSANYRSAVVHGTAVAVTDAAAKARVLDAFVDRFSPGRSGQLRAATVDELANTSVLRVPLTEASVKVRAHGVKDDPEDLGAEVWAGVVPLRLTAGVGAPDDDHAATFPPPALPVSLE